MTSALLGFVGDLVVHREDPDAAFAAVRDVLAAPDVLFGNVEAAYSDRPAPFPGTPIGVGSPARNLDAIPAAGFDVVSMATNHILDLGYDAMLETRQRLRAAGVATCGAGANEFEAHEPAIREAAGLRFAYLSFASVFPMGYEAGRDVPGLAPVRSYDLWRSAGENYHLPGSDPVAISVRDDRDFARLADELRRARENADVVIASFHWGDHTKAFHLTEHETSTARFAIDHGADLVIGHHHHAIRGMEWYRGKPIVYGLGHFVLDLHWPFDDAVVREFAEPGREDASYDLGPRAGWPLLPMHKDTRMTMVAWARADRSGVAEIGFLPCRLAPDGVVHPLRQGTPEYDAVLAYFERCLDVPDLNGRLDASDPVLLAGYEAVRVLPR